MSEEKALVRPQPSVGDLQKGWEMYLDHVPTALIIEELHLEPVAFLKFCKVRAREIAETDRAMEKAVVIHKQNELLKVAMRKVNSDDPDLEWAKFGLEVLKEQRSVILMMPTTGLPPLAQGGEYDSSQVAEALKKRRMRGKADIQDAEESEDPD